MVGFSYDAAGNLLSDGATTSTYDALGRTLTQGSTSYSYNGDGVLVQAGATAYVQDLAAPLSQVLSDPSTGLGAGGSANYIYGLDRLASSAGTWYLGDALGSVRQTLDASGAVLNAASYDPWGTPVAGMIAPFGFTGELQDGAGQVYLRARWYNAGAGTFTTRDPFEGYLTRPGSLHPYHYVYQNPILWTDPTGYDMDAMSYFLWGIVAQFAYNNGNLVPEARAKLAPTSCEPFPMMVGRHVGNIATTLQGLAEITAGSGGMAGGGGLCITGVGCLAGAPLAVASAAVAAHGVAVVGQAGASEIELIVRAVTGGGTNNSASPRLFPNLIPGDQPKSFDRVYPNDIRSVRAGERYMYVVTEDGELIMGRASASHIDLAGGRAVRAAGEVKVWRGRIAEINNLSGHYQPNGLSAEQESVNAFQKAGFDGVLYKEYRFP